jgi:hypothetical protein
MSNPGQFTVDIDGQMDTRDAPRAKMIENNMWSDDSFPYRGREKGCHAVSIFANPVLENKPNPNDPGVLVIEAVSLYPKTLTS